MDKNEEQNIVLPMAIYFALEQSELDWMVHLR